MGKGCVRFKSLGDFALDVVGRTMARVSVEEHIANYQAARALMGKGKSSAKKTVCGEEGEKGEMSDMAVGLGSRPGRSV